MDIQADIEVSNMAYRMCVLLNGRFESCISNSKIWIKRNGNSYAEETIRGEIPGNTKAR